MKTKNFIQRLLQSGQIGPKTALHLIISKLDKLRQPDNAAEALECASNFETDFNAQFSSKVAKIHSWQIAARPTDGSLPTKEVIAALFATWVETTYRYQSEIKLGEHAVTPARDFSRFTD